MRTLVFLPGFFTVLSKSLGTQDYHSVDSNDTALLYIVTWLLLQLLNFPRLFYCFHYSWKKITQALDGQKT